MTFKEDQMVRWLYRYVFRGIGITFLIGMITILILELNYQMHRSANKLAVPAAKIDPRR